jgi:hypothetical protein
VRERMTTEDVTVSGPTCGKGFVMEHWKMFLLFAIGAVLVVVGAILVLLWFVGQAQLNGLVPATLGLWTMGFLVTFLLNLIFWEVLLIGIPVIVAGIVIWQWWKRLPMEARYRPRSFRSRSRQTGGGNAVSWIVFIAFCIKIYLDGNWNLAFSAWTVDYLVSSVLMAMVAVLIIFGVPIAIGLIWWVRRRRRANP